MSVSPREMSQLPVDAIVLEMLARHGLSTHRLQLEITEEVAEGVETREELDALRALGSPLLQGFYFMRPAPLAKVIAWAAWPS